MKLMIPNEYVLTQVPSRIMHEDRVLNYTTSILKYFKIKQMYDRPNLLINVFEEEESRRVAKEIFRYVVDIYGDKSKEELILLYMRGLWEAGIFG